MIAVKSIVEQDGGLLYSFIRELSNRGKIGFVMVFDSMDFFLLEPINGFSREEFYKEAHSLPPQYKFKYMIFEFDKPGIYAEPDFVESVKDIFNVSIKNESEYTDIYTMDLESLEKELKLAIEKENYELCSKLQALIKNKE